MQTHKHPANVPLVLLSLFVVLFVFFLYTFLHEAGHAIAGFLFGQSLTEFNVSFWNFDAHVGMTGGNLTQAQRAVQSIAGTVLPFLVWALFMGFAPRKASFTLEALKLISSMVVLNTLLAWIVLPVLYLAGTAPPSDDVTHFLLYSHISPLLLMFTAIVVYLRGWSYFLSKIDGLRNEFLLFRTTDREMLTHGIYRIIPTMMGIAAFCLLLVFALNRTAVKDPLNLFSPPPDFAPVAEIDLSVQSYAATLTEFSVDQPAYIGIFISVRDINTSYFDLSVVGPAGYSSVVLHGEGYRADQDGGLWEEKLLPGTYRLVLTSQQSQGTASIFLNTP